MENRDRISDQAVDNPKSGDLSGRILLVEDDPIHRELIQESLEGSHNWSIDYAATLNEALDSFSNSNYDLVLIDYKLPDGTGLDLLDWVPKTTKVIIMTSQGSERIAVEALKGGADDYVIKDGLMFDMLPELINQAFDTDTDKKNKPSRVSEKVEPVENQIDDVEKLKRSINELEDMLCGFSKNKEDKHGVSGELNSFNSHLQTLLDNLNDVYKSYDDPEGAEDISQSSNSGQTDIRDYFRRNLRSLLGEEKNGILSIWRVLDNTDDPIEKIETIMAQELKIDRDRYYKTDDCSIIALITALDNAGSINIYKEIEYAVNRNEQIRNRVAYRTMMLKPDTSLADCLRVLASQ